MGKNWTKIFTFAYGQAGSGDPSPPLTVSLTVKYPVFFTASKRKQMKVPKDYLSTLATESGGSVFSQTVISQENRSSSF